MVLAGWLCMHTALMLQERGSGGGSVFGQNMPVT